MLNIVLLSWVNIGVLKGMNQKISETLTQTPEWTTADVALKADSQLIAIELRQFRMPESELITRAYKQLNGDVLPTLSSKSRGVLLELAKVLGRNTGNTWTFALTRVEGAVDEEAGLSLDGKRIRVLGLASKRGVQTWFGKVCNSYGPTCKPRVYAASRGWAGASRRSSSCW